MSKKNVYYFGGGKADGKANMKNLLGGKGANLAEMSSLGIPVPAGYTITTDMCTAYYENKGKVSKELIAEAEKSLKKVEKVMGKKFGCTENPLLLSVPMARGARSRPSKGTGERGIRGSRGWGCAAFWLGKAVGGNGFK